MKYLNKFRLALFLSVIAFSIIFSLPNFMSEKKRETLPNAMQPINLGLDLKGGAYLLLEADINLVINEKLENLKNNIRNALLYSKDNIKIGYRGLSVKDFSVVIFIPDAKELSLAKERIKRLDYTLEIEEKNQNLYVFYGNSTINEIKKSAMERAIAIIRKRIDAVGMKEPSIQMQGDKYIAVQLPGIKDPERIKDLIGKTAKLTFHKVNSEVENINSEIPSDTAILPMFERDGAAVPIYKKSDLGGENLVKAYQGYDRNGRPAVNIEFNSAGASIFAKLTEEYVGQRFAIVLDNKVLTAPVINEPIPGGRAEITGNFTVETAKDLGVMLESGALPAPLQVVEERTVGPELGSDSIKAGAIACGVGLILVIIFMIAAYGLFGLFADITLFFNIALLFAVLSLFGATLTLPGIAGIVLTIGMAVDANVLIYERMREEKRNGMTLFKIIESGYDRAFITILDSNITTLAAALFLFQFGSGPVKGFAVTLSIGVLTSMYTSIVISRMLITIWASIGNKNKTIPI